MGHKVLYLPPYQTQAAGTKKAEYNENGAWLAAAVRATFPDRTVDSGPFRDKKFGNQKKSKIRQLLEMCFYPLLGLSWALMAQHMLSQ